MEDNESDLTGVLLGGMIASVRNSVSFSFISTSKGKSDLSLDSLFEESFSESWANSISTCCKFTVVGSIGVMVSSLFDGSVWGEVMPFIIPAAVGYVLVDVEVGLFVSMLPLVLLALPGRGMFAFNLFHQDLMEEGKSLSFVLLELEADTPTE